MIRNLPQSLIQSAERHLQVNLAESLDTKLQLAPVDKNTLLHQMGAMSAAMIGGNNFQMAEIPEHGYLIQFDKDGSTEVHHVDKNLQGGYKSKGKPAITFIAAMKNHIQSLVDAGKDVKIAAHASVAKNFHGITTRVLAKSPGYEMSEPTHEDHPITGDAMISWHIKKSPTQITESKENFDKWFGKSILKNDDGTPTHFFHGTGADIKSYSYQHVGKGVDQLGSGFYFTDSPDVASGYANDERNAGGHPNVQRVHLRVEKPIDPEDETPFHPNHIHRLISMSPRLDDNLENYGDVSYHGKHRVLRDAVDTYTELPKINAMHALSNDFYRGHEGEFLKNLKAVTKHDAVIDRRGSSTIVNVFHPNQIKSAIGNKGTYSRRKDDITESTDVHGELKSFRDKWNDIGVKNFVFANGDTTNLSQIVVPKSTRNTGVGTKYMKELTAIADKHNQRLTLTPSSDFGGTKSRLIEFYKRHGFVENKGKNKDYTTMETMYRMPTTLNESIERRFEDWLHIEHRKPMTPIEHVRKIVSEHKELGWKLKDDEQILHSPMITARGGMGCQKSIWLENDDGKQMIIHTRFKVSQNHPTTEYKISREHREHVND